MITPTIAIDFGTSRTKIAYFEVDRREPRLIELGREVRSVIPSVFYVPRKGEVLVGDDAIDMLDHDAEGLILGLKKEIHRSGLKHLGPERTSRDRIELASCLFSFIRKKCRDEVFHCDVTKVVLTFPVAFEEQKRHAIRQAAERAGFRDISSMDEPVAAARHWLNSCGKRIGKSVVVCDIGGGTTDLALLQYRDGEFEAVADVRAEGTLLGGTDIDEAVWDAILRSNQMEPKAVRYKTALLFKLSRIKEVFARHSRQTIPIEVADSKIDVPRSFVEAEIGRFVAKIVERVRSFLDRCESIGGIKDCPVLLVGGGARLPNLKESLEALIPGRVFQWNDSDYATALGAVVITNKSTDADKTASAATPGTAATGRAEQSRQGFSESFRQSPEGVRAEQAAEAAKSSAPPPQTPPPRNTFRGSSGADGAGSSDSRTGTGAATTTGVPKTSGGEKRQIEAERFRYDLATAGIIVGAVITLFAPTVLGIRPFPQFLSWLPDSLAGVGGAIFFAVFCFSRRGPRP